MAYTFTVAGYTFENPPEEARKQANLGNNPQPAVDRDSPYFYQSDSQDLQLQVDGTLALDPALGGTDDLDELERLQELSIEGGEVHVDFDPFFSGRCVIEDDPFRQSGGESQYSFTFTVNSEDTDASAYPAHDVTDTGNTFELGSLDLGYDPRAVTQNYEHQTEKVERLQGIARSVDNQGVVPKVTLSGDIDGGGQQELWEMARSNTLAYLNAEFQNGWALVDSLQIRKRQEAPHYLQGMYGYDLDLLVVADPQSGIGDVSKYTNRDVQDQTSYVSDCGGDGVFNRLGSDGQADAFDIEISGGTGKLDGEYLQWDRETFTLDTSATNYIWVEDPGGNGYGQVATGTNGFPGNAVSLYEVDTTQDSINQATDYRSCLMGENIDRGDLGDLNFSDSLELADSDPAFFRTTPLTESVPTPSDSVTYTGVVPFTDTLSVQESSIFPVVSSTSFTDTPSVNDGGTADTSGTGGADLQTDIESNGQSVTATVYEDTTGDGTADNQETVSLEDGVDTTRISSFEGGGDSYWIRFDLSTTDDTTSPRVNSATVDPFHSSGSDQNPNTQWEIQGAQHDTSGNEYEGGGVTSVYGG